MKAGAKRGVSRLKTTAAVDLGVAISGVLTRPGQRRQQWEIAAFAGCSVQAIDQTEKRALRKMRDGLRARGVYHSEIMELFQYLAR